MLMFVHWNLLFWFDYCEIVQGDILCDTKNGIAFFDIDLLKVDMEAFWIAFHKESIFLFTDVFLSK